MKKTVKANSNASPGNSTYMHDSSCFVCQNETNKESVLNGCDLCTRSYHSQCAQFITNVNKQRVCPCCQQKRACQFCQHCPSDEEQVLVCTICLLPVHSKCYWTSKGVVYDEKGPSSAIFDEFTEEERQGVIFWDKSYVCKQCLFRLGITKVKKVRRTFTFKNFESEERVMGLVQVKHKSPIHFGWFSEKDISKVFKMQIENPIYSKKFKQAKTFHPKFLHRPLKMEKIIAMKRPNSLLELNFQEALELIRNKERDVKLKYGSPANFKFLVKWEKSEYDLATWEDEMTVKMLDCRHFLIEKYFYQNLPNNPEGKYGFLSAQIKENLLFIDRQTAGIASKMAKYRWRYPIEIVISQKNWEIKMPICAFLNQLYLLQKEKFPTIILTTEVKLLEWQQALACYSEYLNFVCLVGSNRSINLIKTIDFSLIKESPKFDVLLMSYERYQRERDYILFYVSHSALYICCDFQSSSFIEHFNTRSIQKSISDHFMFLVNRVINNPAVEEELVKNICSYFQKNLVLRHTLTWSEIEIVTAKRFMNGSNGVQSRKGELQISKVVKIEPYPELKRVCFLAFILAKGLNIKKLDETYQQMLENCKSVYQNNSESSRSIFRSYVRSFFTVLTHCNQFQISKEIVSYFFFDLDPIEVIRQVLQLNKLRQVINIKDYVFSVCSGEEQKCNKESAELKTWTNSDDLVLANLILCYGFGSWVEMAGCTEWDKYTLSRQPRRIRFDLYIKIKAISEGRKQLNAVCFISQRAQSLLQRMSMSL